MRTLNKVAIGIAAIALCAGIVACSGGATVGKSVKGEVEKTYSATQTGFDGTITVSIKVENGRIEWIRAVGSGETANVGGEALEEFNKKAFLRYFGKTVEEASKDKLDAVSSASHTSSAVIGAFEAALALARGETVAKKPLADSSGVYEAIGHSIVKKMQVKVVTAGGKIASVEVVDSGETAPIFKTVTDKLIPRIIDAQSIGVDAITGATVSSNGVKAAVSKAIIAAGGDPAQWNAPVAPSTKQVKLEGYDVIVVGLGGSGMSAYTSAAEKGAAVFGFDAAAKIGGTSTNVSGPMAINSKVKMDADNGGKKFVEESELEQDWLAYTRGDAKPGLVKLMINESGKTMDWLIGDHGFKFSPIMAFFHPKGWKVWAAYAGDKDDMYTSTIKAAKAKNPKSDYMLELRATDLITDAKGAVVGVKARLYDGTQYEIRGKSVVLATGGYAGNAEMEKKYLGGVWKLDGMQQNDGAGIRMATAVGANTYNIAVPPVQHIATNPNLIMDDDKVTPKDKAVLAALVLDGDSMIVGDKGKRFLDETGNISFAAWKGGPRYFAIYDAAQLASYKASGFKKANAPFFMVQGGKIADGEAIPNLDDVVAVGAAHKDVYKADTIDALAASIGVDSATLASEVAAYNACADGAKDPLGKAQAFFHPIKTGPFYAIAGAPYVYSTCGGLDVDEKINVLDKKGAEIPGLYAVGNDSMGVILTEKDAYVTYGGAAHGWVLTSGRLAGTNAATYALAKK
jgi:Succinate dehydrogenase/fumarate reductase, flavoprotein subunit